MNHQAQHTAAELPPSNVYDLQGISLGDLAGLADGGDEVIQGVVARMVGDEENLPLVSTTMFNSSI